MPLRHSFRCGFCTHSWNDVAHSQVLHLLPRFPSQHSQMMCVTWQISRSVRAASCSNETPQSRVAMRKSLGAMPATPSGAFHRKVHKSSPSGSCSGASGQYHGRPSNNLLAGRESQLFQARRQKCYPAPLVSKRGTSAGKNLRVFLLTAPVEEFG